MWVLHLYGKLNSALFALVGVESIWSGADWEAGRKFARRKVNVMQDAFIKENIFFDGLLEKFSWKSVEWKFLMIKNDFYGFIFVLSLSYHFKILLKLFSLSMNESKFKVNLIQNIPTIPANCLQNVINERHWASFSVQSSGASPFRNEKTCRHTTSSATEKCLNTLRCELLFSRTRKMWKKIKQNFRAKLGQTELNEKRKLWKNLSQFQGPFGL